VKSLVSDSTLSEVKEALKAYYDAVEASDLSQSSQATYIDMANNFVRWMGGEFTPGSRKEPYRVTPSRNRPPRLRDVAP
jgi:hypothetical protein